MPEFRLFSLDGPSGVGFDDTNTNLAVEFYVTSPAELIKVWWWRANVPNGAGTGGAGSWVGPQSWRLWHVDSATVGTSIANGTWSEVNSTVLGWKSLSITPVTLVVNQRYRMSLRFLGGGTGTVKVYGSVANYWSTGEGGAGLINGPLTAPNSAASIGADQGSFVTGAENLFPINSFNAANYQVDISVETPFIDPQSGGSHNSDAMSQMGAF